MAFYNKLTPEEEAERDRVAAHVKQTTLLEQVLKSKAVDVKATADRIQGDRLKRDRRRARVATAEAEIVHHQKLRREALAAHIASEVEDAFNPSDHDAAIARWTAELASRQEMLQREEGILAEAVALHAAAQLEERRAKHRLGVCELTELVHQLRAKAMEVISLEGRGVSSVVQELGLQQILSSTANAERMVSTYLVPPAKKALDPMCAVRCLQNIDHVDGPLDGRLFLAQEGCTFPSETAARLVAQGLCEYLIPNSQNAAAAEKAGRALAAAEAERYAGMPKVGIEMGQGVATNG